MNNRGKDWHILRTLRAEALQRPEIAGAAPAWREAITNGDSESVFGLLTGDKMTIPPYLMGFLYGLGAGLRQAAAGAAAG